MFIANIYRALTMMCLTCLFVVNKNQSKICVNILIMKVNKNKLFE